jgi:hypothetical protein
MELDGPVRRVLITLMPLFPAEVWAGIAPRLLAQRSLSHFRLEQLLRPESDDNLASGPLFGIPSKIYLDWVRKDPARRAGLVARWLPVAVKNDTGALEWHPAIEAFVAEFGAHKPVLDAIAMRIHPRSAWGSLAPYLAAWLPLLNAWLTHPTPEVRTWAQDTLERLNRAVDAERKRNEENDVHLG